MRASVVVLVLCGAVGAAADKPTVAELKKQLAEAEAKVAAIKAKLAADEPAEFKNVGFIAPGLMKVGERGQLSNYNQQGGPISIHKVLQVIDDDTVLLQPDEGDRRLPNVIVKGFPAKGLADGHVFNSDGRVWKVVGTEKFDGQTLMVIRPDGKAIPQPDPKPAPKVVQKRK